MLGSSSVLWEEVESLTPLPNGLLTEHIFAISLSNNGTYNLHKQNSKQKTTRSNIASELLISSIK